MNVLAHVNWGKCFSKRPNVSMLISLIGHSFDVAVDANIDSVSLLY